MTVEALKKDVAAAVDAMRAELLELSHAIHQEPELALEEFKAAARLSDAVAAHDLPVQREVFGLKTAYASEFGNEEGPFVAILSEYDALPGVGHACGHNIIATAGLGAALALAKLGARLPGRVRYLGTPAEERFGGKEMMAREGAFEGVDAAMMVHPASLDLVSMPCIAVSEVDVTYFGRAAHASAMPYRGLNALDAVVSAYQSIAQLRQHIRQTDRIHGIITEGGLAPNIVPERAGCRFYVRAADMHELAALKARVQACFEAAALSTGCRVQTHWGNSDYLDLKVNWPLAEAYARNIQASGRELTPLSNIPRGYAGSTDMGNVSHRVPSIHPMLAVAPEDVVIHNAEFARWAASERGDAAVIDGAKSLALTALDLMCDSRLLERTRADFAATADLSTSALAQLKKTVPQSVPAVHHHHGHAGCGCS
jgi:amidohydrolase